MFERWSNILVNRTRSVLAVGVLATVAAGVFGIGVFDSLGQGGFDDPGSQSARQLEREREAFGNQNADLVVIFSSEDQTVDDPAFRENVEEALAEVPEGSTVSVLTYWQTQDPSMVSTDKQATTALVSLAGETQDEMSENAGGVMDTVESDELEVQIAGTWAVYQDVNTTVSEDLARAEALSLPLVIILSLLIFGSAVAALMPALVGAIAVLGAMSVVRLLTGFTEVSVFSINVITLLGTGLAIDYALFVVSRFREELGRLPEDDPRASAKADPDHDGHGRTHRVVLRVDRRGGDVVAADLPAELPAVPGVRRHGCRARRGGRGADRAARDPDAARSSHRRRPDAVAPEPPGRGLQ